MEINKRIEDLLNAYYSGKASAAEISELREIFLSAGSLSPELETEKNIFLAIEGSRPVSEEISIPDTLLGQLENVIDNLADNDNIFEDTKKNKKPFYIRFAIAASAAAAVILIATFSWKIIDYATDGIDLKSQPVLLEASAGNVDEKEDSTVSTPANDTATPHNSLINTPPGIETPVKTPIKPQKATKHKNYVAKVSSNSKAKRRHANIRVVSNPEEANLLVDQVMTLLQKNVQNAQIASDKTDIAIESIVNDINRIDL